MSQKSCKFPKEREKLRRLIKRDQYIRTHGDFTKVETVVEMYRIDLLNQKQLKKILDNVKVPTVQNIGTVGTEAVWLIAQHAMNDLELMLRVLGMMQKIASNSPDDTYYRGIPLLIDRSNILQGKKQLFGSQFWADPTTGKPSPFPIEDIENIDARRKKYGLEPFDDYCKRIMEQPAGKKKKVLEVLYC